MIALLCPLYVEEGGIFDNENRRVATIFEVSNPKELLQLKPAKGDTGERKWPPKATEWPLQTDRRAWGRARGWLNVSSEATASLHF